MFDYHVHTSFSDDARSPIDDIIRAAIGKNLEGIAITDHLDPYYQDDEYPWELDIAAYEAALTRAREQYASRIDVAKGIEIGLIEGDGLRVCEETVSGFGFDFVIASVHHTASGPIHTSRFINGRTLAEVIEEYYASLHACLKSYKNYDVIGHLNVIDRYTDEHAPEALYMPFADEIMRLAVADGKGLEVNTSAFRYGMGDRGTPTPALLRRFKELGGEIVTVGSDAHEAKYVGAYIEKGEEMLLAAGFTHVASFQGRQPTFHPLG
jgi:histidinol-phosphatase (PHP family)